MELHYRYPRDGSMYMNAYGPSDRRFEITDGALLYDCNRDGRFPYIYEIKKHALVHSHHFDYIWIHVVDTSEEARIRHGEFADSLSVPLGPEALMEKYGK
jgi:hypothetical protein